MEDGKEGPTKRKDIFKRVIHAIKMLIMPIVLNLWISRQ